MDETKPLEEFLKAAERIHSTGGGVKETSYYGGLEQLFNEIGKTLKPHVFCVLTLANKGAGSPDAGFYSDDQREKKKGHTPRAGQKPLRGAIEVKPPGPKFEVEEIAKGEQAQRYLKEYKQVLVTNLRDWLLAGYDHEGKPVTLERYTLAGSEREFWEGAAHPQKTAAAHGVRFGEYLKRVMLHRVRLDAPEDVAFFLASYAKDALARIESVPEVPALGSVRSSLEEALGIKFEDEKGEHFFRSSLIQTLFYGVFSAWVLWARQRSPGSKERFDWSMTARLLRVPVLRKLFHEVADPGQLEELRLSELMDWSAALLTRVDRANFFQRFQEEYAVQYFYEPFLEAFDPDLRKQLGVWYTPPEIVKYMVARVDTALREELNCKDGLADRKVFVLDPGNGTGSYLVEVLRSIEATLREQGQDALLAAEVKEAAIKRIRGFELIPASFVVAHLQIGLLLQQIGAPLDEQLGERAGVFLTNSLTGWEAQEQKPLVWPEMEEERRSSGKVKREEPILVILGNPPYNAFAGVSPKEEETLVEPYKEGLVKEWGIKKFNLDDLYVRFFRIAERRIVDREPHKGIVCYISNFSYLGDPSFVVMRKRFLNEFDKLWFDCLNGDSRQTGKMTPDGKPDPSVFSTERNREGIRVGTSIALLVRKGTHAKRPIVRFRHFWGENKRNELMASLGNEEFDDAYFESNPSQFNRFSFRPTRVSASYSGWPSLSDLPGVSPTLGILENREEALISVDRSRLEERMKHYFDKSLTWEAFGRAFPALAKDFARFDAKETRLRVLAKEEFNLGSVRKLVMRPMDSRWCYYTSVRPLWNEPRPDYAEECWLGNRALVSRRKGVASPEGVPFFLVSSMGYQHALSTDAYFCPLRLRSTRGEKSHAVQTAMPGIAAIAKANYSPLVRRFLHLIGIADPESDSGASLVWMHCLAIGYSSEYLSENADGIRLDWPRIPLPNGKELLEASAALGEQVAALLDTEAGVAGVTEGEIREELRHLGVVRKAGSKIGDLKSQSKETQLGEGDLVVTAGWGHAGKEGVTMPGKGRLVERDYSEAERKAIAAGAKNLGLSEKEALAHLGERTCDVYLNDVAYWENVPVWVWEYTIGGYQVMKKWLSYREEKLLGRALKKEEARYVTEMTRRIAAILLLEPKLDENYRRVKANTYPWDSLKERHATEENADSSLRSE